MDWTLEVVVLPVSDIERSIAFYRDQLGFALDHDTVTPQMHVTQLTPWGSGCSIVSGWTSPCRRPRCCVEGLRVASLPFVARADPHAHVALGVEEMQPAHDLV